MILRRLLWLFRAPGPKCLVGSCPHTQLPTLSKWCRDHTDAIIAGGPTDPDCEVATRLGARRWLLLAEVRVERERVHVPVLEGILNQTDDERRYSRVCWDQCAPTDLEPPLAARVDELLAHESTLLTERRG